MKRALFEFLRQRFHSSGR